MFCWDPVNNIGTIGSRQSIILVGTGTYLYAMDALMDPTRQISPLVKQCCGARVGSWRISN
jgi:hypothetical protein